MADSPPRRKAGSTIDGDTLRAAGSLGEASAEFTDTGDGEAE
jgi:hypothetical protein